MGAYGHRSQKPTKCFGTAPCAQNLFEPSELVTGTTTSKTSMSYFVGTCLLLITHALYATPQGFKVPLLVLVNLLKGYILYAILLNYYKVCAEAMVAIAASKNDEGRQEANCKGEGEG